MLYLRSTWVLGWGWGVGCVSSLPSRHTWVHHVSNAQTHRETRTRCTYLVGGHLGAVLDDPADEAVDPDVEGELLGGRAREADRGDAVRGGLLGGVGGWRGKWGVCVGVHVYVCVYLPGARRSP